MASVDLHIEAPPTNKNTLNIPPVRIRGIETGVLVNPYKKVRTIVNIKRNIINISNPFKSYTWA